MLFKYSRVWKIVYIVTERKFCIAIDNGLLQLIMEIVVNNSELIATKYAFFIKLDYRRKYHIVAEFCYFTGRRAWD